MFEANRTLFGFAAYNAGPGNIAKAPREAGTRGLVAYTLMLQADAERKAARERMTPGTR